MYLDLVDLGVYYREPTLNWYLLTMPACLLLVLDLVRKGVDVTRADAKGRTALHFASCRGDANLGRWCVNFLSLFYN